MKVKANIVDLGERFAIEAPHTGHVARLALALFDGFFPFDGLVKKDRRLLFAAAYLHDIAYSTDPQDHVLEGARILADNPIEGFTPEEWKSVIAIAMLHKRDWRAMLTHELFPSVDDVELARIKKLAAILRIADGLDHGHIQDATIFYCRRGNKVDKIGVECGWYEDNIPWAEGKADLWEAVFKRPFRFEGKYEPGKKLFKNVVFANDSAAAAARRILYSQAAVMRDNVPGMLEGKNLECLHDYRVAMRRFRAAIAMFAPILDGTSARILDEQMGGLSDKLSPVRDVHVALRFFKALDNETVHLSEIIQSLEKDVAESNQLLCEILQSDDCLQVVQIAQRFLRVELPVLEQNCLEPPFADLAKNQVQPLLKEIGRQHVWGLREEDPAHMHKVRKLCRRGRYYAEFAAPVLGKKVQRTAKHLKTIAGTLGDVRDAKVMLRRFAQSDALDLIKQHENEAWMRFAKAWRKHTDT